MSICPRTAGREVQRFDTRLEPLQTLLTPRSLEIVGGGKGSSGKLGERQGRDRDLSGKSSWVDLLATDHHRRIDQTAPFGRVNHGA